MAVIKIEKTIELELLNCGGCGTVFGVSKVQVEQLRRTHDTFYCPNGCERHYPQKSEAELLRDQLVEQKRRAEFLEADAQRAMQVRDAQAKQIREMQVAHAKVTSRVSKGVCPCCNRTFRNLARHMATQHALDADVARIAERTAAQQAKAKPAKS